MKELIVFIVSFISLILSIIVMATSSKLKDSSDTLVVNRANTVYNAGTGLFVISLIVAVMSGYKVFMERKKYGLATSYY